jgi:hypothetical protein
MLNEIKNALRLIDLQQQNLIPSNFLSIILGNLADIQSKFEAADSTLINAKLSLIQDIQNQLFAFTNLTYSQNLIIFKQAQQTFLANTDNASLILISF